MEKELYIKYKTSGVVYLKSMSTGSVCCIDEEYLKTDIRDVITEIDKKVPFKKQELAKNAAIYVLTTIDCNLNCSYCFENGARNKTNRGVMNVTDTVNFLKEYIFKNKPDILEVIFTGGEPLIHFEKIEEVVKLIEKLEFNSKIQYGLITNGVLLDDKKCKFFHEHNFNVQISLDGDRRNHNKYRYYVKGQNVVGTYDILLRKISRILLKYKGIKLSLRLNITNENKESLESLIFDLAKIQKIENAIIYADFVSVEKKSPSYINTTQKKDLMSRVIDLFIESNLTFSHIIKEGGDCMIKDDYSITIAPEGSVYPCYSLVSISGFRIGNIKSGYVKKALKGCEKKCSLNAICKGGCPYNTYVERKQLDRHCSYDYLSWINRYVFMHEIKMGGVQGNVSIDEMEYVEV